MVVADIFRATSCMVTGLAYGVKSITPVATVEECKTLQNQGYLAAAERDAMKVEGFDLDNSPFSYMSERLIGAHIAMTTTNGTLSIAKAKVGAVKVMVGAFLNLGLKDQFMLMEDSVLMAQRLYLQGRDNLPGFVANSSHVRRLQRLGIQKDITYSLQSDLYDVVPILRGNQLVALH